MSTSASEIGRAPRRSAFKSAFYVANLMEIFERLAWYGFFTVASLYMTSPSAQGGLGFTEQQRGVLQGIIPFLLYVFPVFTGALGDRYGYRKMFVLAFIVMTPSYYLLGQVHHFWTFFAAFLAVAVGAAIFKPLVLGTVSRTTDDSNRGLGFGIFYTMVNVGGFLGPLVAGTVRGSLGWDWVFVMAAVWIAVNFIPILFFYRDPSVDTVRREDQKSFRQTLLEMQMVLGNGRCALIVVPSLILLMLAGGGWIGWTSALYLTGGWLLVNFVWNLAVGEAGGPWYRQKARIGNGPFVLYILVMAGFWMLYQQLFYTLPLYIRDYVDTGHLVQAAHALSPAFVGWLAHVDLPQLTAALQDLQAQYGTAIDAQSAQAIMRQLTHYKVMVPPAEIIAGLQTLSADPAAVRTLAAQWAGLYRQINPEYLMSLNFLSILLLQIGVSLFAEKRRPILILTTGTLLIAAAYAATSITQAVAFGGIVVIVCVVVFSFGEMLASPKSQDYVAGIMPTSKAAMFMGYYFVSMALGFLFGGLLSGWSYDYFANTLNRPEWMWLTFGLIGLWVALGLVLFNRFVAPRLEAQKGAHP